MLMNLQIIQATLSIPILHFEFFKHDDPSDTQIFFEGTMRKNLYIKCIIRPYKLTKDNYIIKEESSEKENKQMNTKTSFCSISMASCFTLSDWKLLAFLQSFSNNSKPWPLLCKTALSMFCF